MTETKHFRLSDEEYGSILDVSRQPMMMIGGVAPNPQASANAIWKRIAEREGVVWDSIRPYGSDPQDVVADVIPTPPRETTITINIETGAWVGGVPTLVHPEGLIVACSVMPGLTPELLDDWYGQWMSHDDPSDTGKLRWVSDSEQHAAGVASGIVTAVASLVAVAANMTDAYDMLGNMQCVEIEAIAGVVRAAGADALADQLIAAHARSDDDPDDMHHKGAPS